MSSIEDEKASWSEFRVTVARQSRFLYGGEQVRGLTCF